MRHKNYKIIALVGLMFINVEEAVWTQNCDLFEDFNIDCCNSRGQKMCLGEKTSGYFMNIPLRSLIAAGLPF